MQKLVFGHHPCLDGTAAMWALSRHFPDDAIAFQGMNHHDAHQAKVTIHEKVAAMPEGMLDIYFVDYVPNMIGVVQELLDAGHRITILDHHQTSEHNIADMWMANQDNPNLDIRFDYERSGATIAWQAYAGHEPTPALLQLVEQMDLLSLHTEEEEKAAAYIDSIPLTDDIEANLAALSSFHAELEKDGLAGLAAKGEAEWQEKAAFAHRIIEETRHEVTIGEHRYPAVHIPDVTELGRAGVGHIMHELTSPEQPVAIMVKQSPHIVTLNIRVHPDHSDMTHDITEEIKDAAKAVTPEKDHWKISGGGRGINGQIGQSACRMPTSVAMKMGLIEEAPEQAKSAGRTR